ncbi:GlsB/YeaQ/YmgE family stress response membrane protein [Serinibacter arcticus]|uniref:GlsB/YeaQ/YmgE family stress response membrane protein n=1 Tax=Serinibacter arcticus TaxID=1655435 RepID=A0A2U1ZXT1_9MICO|nr:GlsB/YeaQ/YmgE family stress response membrane protein [Serinibacter arcticus]PWD51781.1 GlsB/YeaQ/YmgE family stress response membrane protein [Serinibacter arcticus]
MGILGWIVLGLIAGAIAKAVLKDRAPGGILATLVIGVVGALLGGFLGSVLFDAPLEEFWSLQTWLLAIGGSLLVLVIYGALAGRKGSARR